MQIIRRISVPVLLLSLLVHCENPDTMNEKDPHAYHLGVIDAFSELVGGGAKRLALSHPMTNAEADALLDEARRIAAGYGVEVYREPELLATDLFPAGAAAEKEVLLLYRGAALDAYRQLKADKAQLEAAGEYEGAARQAIARRFGRLLSYPPARINELLAANTDFRTMRDFGVRAGNVFLYYRDLERAAEFYTRTLGIEQVADHGIARILRLGTDAYLTLVDDAAGMHSADEPKTVALALLTDQLDEWYAYLQEQNVPIKYDYRPQPGSAHDGFVAVDPEGYLLEFERFNQHPENERLLPLLEQAETLPAAGAAPAGLGFKAAVTWLYYKNIWDVQPFYENVLGLELIADQGWTKIYQLTPTAFIGLVDERRGMHAFTEEKAVTLSFLVDDLDGWFDYARTHRPLELRGDSLKTGPERKYRAFVGYDPGGYFLEFDRFYAHPDNGKLLEYLE